MIAGRTENYAITEKGPSGLSWKATEIVGRRKSVKPWLSEQGLLFFRDQNRVDGIGTAAKPKS